MKGEFKFPKLDTENAVKKICCFIKSKLEESKADGLVIGLSGGIDSSAVAYLCAKVVESDKILGLILPSETTSREDIEDAKTVADNLGIKYKTLHIDPLIEPFPEVCPECSNNALANGNLKARIRMMLLYYHSNSMNRLVMGTGNKTELLVGYFTKYGDGGVDVLPIGDLYKTHVREIAEYIGVPKNIIEKAPTAGLWTGQTDEDELGIKYELLDKILYLMTEERLDISNIAECLKIEEDEVLRVKNMVESSKHKLSSPSVIEVS
ncbi:NAD+ synthase [Methanobacterium sp.]|uniref:NAD+ synthase n=1 Tax=Methanobacterium sp. TaxID=2164 RepID=UPI003C77B6E8